MSTEEAIMQMELLGHDFFVYMTEDTEDINILYKRRDGDYGVISPQR
jgi:putative sigma-54 modulation protein